MAKKNDFNELLDTAMAQDNSLGDMMSQIDATAKRADNKPERNPVPSSRSKMVATVEQRRAVDKVRNEQRGRGKSKGARKMIAFQVPEETVDLVEDLSYALGKTKNELYNEALDNLVKKYSKYLNI